MTQKLLVVDAQMPMADAIQLAVLNACCALLQGIPNSLIMQAQTEGWTIPCVLTEDETGAIVSWEAV